MANRTLAAIDTNLFVVLDAVLREGSATRAARRLHVSQSAVSNALAHARQLLGLPVLGPALSGLGLGAVLWGAIVALRRG